MDSFPLVDFSDLFTDSSDFKIDSRVEGAWVAICGVPDCQISSMDAAMLAQDFWVSFSSRYSFSAQSTIKYLRKMDNLKLELICFFL